MKKGILFSLSISIIFVLCLSLSFGSLKEKSTKDDIQRINDGIKQSILECYAIEGKYPESIDYLSENYGIYLNSDLYQIHYRYLGSNMIPEFGVFEKGGK